MVCDQNDPDEFATHFRAASYCSMESSKSRSVLGASPAVRNDQVDGNFEAAFGTIPDFGCVMPFVESDGGAGAAFGADFEPSPGFVCAGTPSAGFGRGADWSRRSGAEVVAIRLAGSLEASSNSLLLVLLDRDDLIGLNALRSG